MKAIVVHTFGGPENLTFESRPDPVAGPNQVVVRVHAIGVNPVETYIRSGTHSVRPNLPYVPGSDAAGVIESVGAGVTGLSVGDRVYVASANSGTYAERVLCPAAHVHRLPDRISFAQGAALGVPYVTAYCALFQRTRAKAGETVLVHGATGSVGIATVEFAHALGLRVFGTGGTEGGLAAARAHGADAVFNHRTDGYADEIMKATGGRGVDLIIEMLANVNLDRDLSLLAKFGRVVVVGNRGRIEINPRDAMARNASILGLMIFNATDAELAEAHAAIIAGLANGTLNPRVGRELPLADAAHAHRAVLESGSLGKIVLTV